MSKIEKQSAALAVFQANPITLDARAKIIAAARAQLETLVGHRKEAPYRAIALGLLLHQLKAGCKHGEWMPLYEQILKSSKFVTAETARTYASQYMRLALTFLTEADAAKPEYIALSQNADLSIESKDATEKTFAGKLEKFIAERSLDELLTDYDLRNAAANKRRKLAAGEAEIGPAEQEKNLQDRFNDIEAGVNLAVAGATDKANWMAMSAQQHRDLRDLFAGAAARVSETFVKTHGRKK